MPPAAPLTVDELAASLDAIGGFEARPLLAVGVSGGPDSMALLLLADRWARQRGGEVWGLTVDHGLRPESADEARVVAGWLAARRIPHETLIWRRPKPDSGIQEAAREARYGLLAAWCRERGCLHLLTAHHLEDQIETHLIRHRAGSGIEGLAGMSAVRELPGCRLVRPLLSVRRERLVSLLAAEKHPFLQDPSNLNPAFERARLRLSGAAAPAQADVVATIRECARERIAGEAALEALIARSVALHPAGFAVLDPAALATADSAIAERLLSRLVGCLGAARYPARRARLARLAAALVEKPERPRTLGGCRFVPWRDTILVLRELAAASPPVALEPGRGLLWDRRFALLLSPDAAGEFTVGYLGQRAAALPEGLRRVLPPLVHSVLPAFWDERGLAAVPHLGYCRDDLPVLPELSFRPVKPLTHASFTVV